MALGGTRRQDVRIEYIHAFLVGLPCGHTMDIYILNDIHGPSKSS